MLTKLLVSPDGKPTPKARMLLRCAKRLGLRQFSAALESEVDSSEKCHDRSSRVKIDLATSSHIDGIKPCIFRADSLPIDTNADRVTESFQMIAVPPSHSSAQLRL